MKRDEVIAYIVIMIIGIISGLVGVLVDYLQSTIDSKPVYIVISSTITVVSLCTMLSLVQYAQEM